MGTAHHRPRRRIDPAGWMSARCEPTKPPTHTQTPAAGSSRALDPGVRTPRPRCRIGSDVTFRATQTQRALPPVRAGGVDAPPPPGPRHVGPSRIMSRVRDRTYRAHRDQGRGEGWTPQTEFDGAQSGRGAVRQDHRGDPGPRETTRFWAPDLRPASRGSGANSRGIAPTQRTEQNGSRHDPGYHLGADGPA